MLSRLSVKAIALPFTLPLAIVAGLAMPLAAQEDVSEGDRLFAALGLPQIIEVMQQEGIAYGARIRDDLFPGQGGSEWSAIVQQIYDADRMQEGVRRDLLTALEGRDIEPIIAFFESEPGSTIIELEIAARSALLDEAVEDAANEAAAIAMADETERYQLIDRFITVNDLIETNVVGSMNSNYAFFTGLMQGGGFPSPMSEDDILSDVWSQEPEMRASTTEWVTSFLLLAYQPLSDADIETYIAFSETQAGRDLNMALFTAFDGVFTDISRALGAGSSRFMIGQEL